MKKYLTPTFLKASLYYFFGLSKKDPIFIVGSGRCGSSLLVDILSTNKNIKISQYEWYYTFLKKLKNGFENDILLTDIIDFKKITRESIDSWTSLDKFYIKVIFKYFSNYSNKVFFLKSPAISMMLNEIDSFFPNAKYIHLYRNGYAVTESLFKKEYFRVNRYLDEYTEIEFKKLSAKYWVLSMQAIDIFLQEKEDVIEISYEEFSNNPEVYISNIFQKFKIKGQVEFDFSTIETRNYKIDSLRKDELKILTPILKNGLLKKDYELLY